MNIVETLLANGAKKISLDELRDWGGDVLIAFATCVTPS
jgi:hypothetical protein